MLYCLYVYGPIRRLTASYSYGEMFTLGLRRRRLKNRCDRAPFIGTPPGGSRGHQVQTGWICTWLSIGFYLLHAIRSLAFTFKMADNIDSQTTIDK